MASYLKRTNIIEGIGDEVLYSVAAFLGVLIPMVAYILKRHQQQPGIHPDSQENVNTIRQRLQQEQERTETQQTPRTPRDSDGQISCPVCLGNAAYAIETNCGHVFCGHCIITYWQHGNWLGAVRCPVCRTQVSILLHHFSEEETNEDTIERRDIDSQINNYNRRFSGQPRPWGDYVRDLPTLLRHAFNEFFSVGGLIWMFRLRVVVCILAAFVYFASPLDILPEAVFGIVGFLDDLFIVLLLAIYITIIYRQIVEARAQRAAMQAQGQGQQ